MKSPPRLPQQHSINKGPSPTVHGFVAATFAKMQRALWAFATSSSVSSVGLPSVPYLRTLLPGASKLQRMLPVARTPHHDLAYFDSIHPALILLNLYQDVLLSPLTLPILGSSPGERRGGKAQSVSCLSKSRALTQRAPRKQEANAPMQRSGVQSPTN